MKLNILLLDIYSYLIFKTLFETIQVEVSNQYSFVSKYFSLDNLSQIIQQFFTAFS